MANEVESLESLEKVWDVCKSQDDKKHELISELFAHARRLKKEKSEIDDELLDKRDAIQTVRRSLEKAKKEIDSLQDEKDRHKFALVVIDGDCMPFRDEFILEGLEGGKRAASTVIQAVGEELHASLPETSRHMKIVVRVYANLLGMADVYKKLDTTVNSPHFDEFVRGFNMGSPLCDYVDAGNGKECSDEKVKAIFNLHLDDVHCQQILFGGSADNGYARLLEPYAGNESIRKRITLLEGPPFAKELADIRHRFRTASLGGVFRNQKLPTLKRRVSFRITPPPTPSVQYATAAARTPNTSNQTADSSQSLPASRNASNEVLRNSSGQRLDSTLSFTQQHFLKLKNLKLCNIFYITGKCSFLENYGNCQYKHNASISSEELVALREVARYAACQKGIYCGDPECVAGHRCPWEKRGKCENRKACRFPQDMHNVDTKVYELRTSAEARATKIYRERDSHSNILVLKLWGPLNVRWLLESSPIDPKSTHNPETMPPRIPARFTAQCCRAQQQSPSSLIGAFAALSVQQPQTQQTRHASILADLRDNRAAYQKRIRVGRGPSSGKGKTSGRGHKGQKQHGKVNPWFQGGQTPLLYSRGRMGFENLRAPVMSEVNLDKLQEWIDQGRIDPTKQITPKELIQSNLVGSIKDGVKILARGGTTVLKQPLDVMVSRASASAIEAIEKAGGKVVTRYYTRQSIRRLVEGKSVNTDLPLPVGAEHVGPVLEQVRQRGFFYRLPDPTSRWDIEYYRDPAHRGYLSHLLKPGESPSLFFRVPPSKLVKTKKQKTEKKEDTKLWEKL
ncbi:hypothetical protein G7054_g6045 [Neopestalotiopsis clavispora]|nr:hypothetical protein G7054_g6045 [Neopestalotiopsis clavispora]